MTRYAFSHRRRMFAAALLASSASRALTQQSDSSGPTPTSKSALIAFVIPESPAFTFLGVAPTKVARAATPRDLAASIINNVDSSGHVQSGFALGATLWTLLPKVPIPLQRYRSNGLLYSLANTQLSIGSAKASGDTMSTNAAVGLRTTVIDRSDPMLNDQFVSAYTLSLDRCIASKKGPKLPLHPPASKADSNRAYADSVNQATESPKDCASRAADSLRKEWVKRHRNAMSMSLAVAHGWRFAQSQWNRGHPIGWSGWANLALPLPLQAQLLNQVQYDSRLAIDTLRHSDVLSLGTRLIRGDESYNFFAEGVWTVAKGSTSAAPPSQYSGGIEFRAGDSYWITTGVGKRYESLSKPNQIVVLLGIRWGISSNSRFTGLN